MEKTINQFPGQKCDANKCKTCAGLSIKKFGLYKNRNGLVQRYWCYDCRKTFSHSNNNGMRVKRDKIRWVLKLLCESSGIRAISRMTRLHQKTILKIHEVAGKISAEYQEEKARDLKCEVVQADEVHTTVYSKEYNVSPIEPHVGSQYTFLAVDAKTRFIINSVTGRRNTHNAVKFFAKLKNRVTGRFQLNTDSWRGYHGSKNSVSRVFGKEIDHCTEEKRFWKPGQFISRRLAKVIRTVRIGNPDLDRGSTSYVERTNLTLRNFNRRFNRCTLGYSKKLQNLRHSVSLFLWSLNFGRKHGAHGTTPRLHWGFLLL